MSWVGCAGTTGETGGLLQVLLVAAPCLKTIAKKESSKKTNQVVCPKAVETASPSILTLLKLFQVRAQVSDVSMLLWLDAIVKWR